MSAELDRAIDAVRRSRDLMDSSTFHGRNRTAELQREVDRLRNPQPKLTKFSDHIAPVAMKAGDTRVMVNGAPVRVDFRVIAEQEYQLLVALAKQAGELSND